MLLNFSDNNKYVLIAMNKEDKRIIWIFTLNNIGQKQIMSPMKTWTNFRVDSGGRPVRLLIASAMPNTKKIVTKIIPNMVQSFNCLKKSIYIDPIKKLSGGGGFIYFYFNG